MVVDYVPHDCEAESSTPGCPRSGLIDPIEAFKYPLDISRGYANTFIPNRYIYPAFVGLYRYFDPLPRV